MTYNDPIAGKIPYRLDKETLVDLQKTILGIARQADAIMCKSEINLARFKTHDGIQLQHYNDKAKEFCSDTNALVFITYPLNFSDHNGKTIGDIKPSIHGDVLSYLRNSEWLQLRRESMAYDRKVRAHYDATINSVWAAHIADKYDIRPEIDEKGLTKLVSINLPTPQGNVRIETELVRIPVEVPSALCASGGDLKTLGEMISIPHCGNDDLQKEFETQYVYGLQSEKDGTVINTSFIKIPFETRDDTYPWRKMRKMARDIYATIKMTDNGITYDRDKDIADYVAQTKAFYAEHGTPGEWYAKRKLAA